MGPSLSRLVFDSTAALSSTAAGKGGVIYAREYPASIPAQLVREEVRSREGLQLGPDAHVVRGRARGALVLVAQLAPERHADRPVRPTRDQRFFPIEQQRICDRHVDRPSERLACVGPARE